MVEDAVQAARVRGQRVSQEDISGIRVLVKKGGFEPPVVAAAAAVGLLAF